MFKKIMSIILIIIIVLSFKLLVINNFYVPKEFYWNSFDFNFKEREYFLEWEDGCKIIEIGKRGKYYYGRVISGGITLYKPGEYDYSNCEDEYFLIDDSNGLDINIYYKNKEDILKVIKKYKPKEPYKFFMFSILRLLFILIKKELIFLKIKIKSNRCCKRQRLFFSYITYSLNF